MTRQPLGRIFSALITATVLFSGLTVAGAAAAEPSSGLVDLQDALRQRHDVELAGFIEALSGWRLQNDPFERQAAIGETRLQLAGKGNLAWGTLKLKADAVGDAITEEVRPELRECSLLSTPHSLVDLKVGRQPLTWGTGDLIFINDLFPKDWISFFIGRDDEYLKAPSDAVKTSLFFDKASLDLVYVPVANPSTYVDGERLSYWNGLAGRLTGRDYILADEERNSFGHDSEYAVRLAREAGGYEYALYYYNGFWSTPEGLDPGTWNLRYPRMTDYGVSIRGPLFGGIGNIEAGYYDSREDRDGDDPLVRNSEIRFLAGFEREIGRELTAGLQYYLEVRQDQDGYVAGLAPDSPKADEYRHLYTLRLTKMLYVQNLRLSLFTYYSPSDNDGYLRPKINYTITDHWTIETGANLFFGKNDHTFWGQFDRNTNMYAGLRCSF